MSVMVSSVESLAGEERQQLSYQGNVLSRRRESAAEFLAWSDCHAHERRRRCAGQAQIAAHPDVNDQRSALAQQLAWARRHAHQEHLRASAIAQLRHD